MAHVLYRLIVALARLAVRSGRSRDLEIFVLRHQLQVLQRSIDRPVITSHDRSLLAAIAAVIPRKLRAGWIVTPETLLRWHRQRINRRWAPPSRPRGRTPTRADIRRQIVRFATENPTWGYRRIHGELARLGHHIAASTVWQILKDNNNIDPAPNRSSVTWSEFLRSQAAVACDFFTIDTVTRRTYYVLFFIDIRTREVFYGGLTANPTAVWTTQAARNLLIRFGLQLTGVRALVRDRGSQFTDAFDAVFQSEDITPLRTPVRVPVSNAYAERWIGSIRRELLDRTLVWNRQQAQRLVTEYIDHYNTHRPHRALNQQPPTQPIKPARASPTKLQVTRTDRRDDIIHEYRKAA